MSDASMTARFFLGLPIELELAKNLKTWFLAENKSIAHHFRWTTFENYHVTMRFLGEVNLELVPPFVSRLAELIAPIHSFAMTLDRIDHFPNPRGRLIAVYVQVSQQMTQLFEAIENAVDQTGIAGKDNRSFKPHITVARPKKHVYTKHINPVELEKMNVLVEQLILYESRPSTNGSVYLPFHQFRFAS